jgi:hypothetical protein
MHNNFIKSLIIIIFVIYSSQLCPRLNISNKYLIFTMLLLGILFITKDIKVSGLVFTVYLGLYYLLNNTIEKMSSDNQNEFNDGMESYMNEINQKGEINYINDLKNIINLNESIIPSLSQNSKNLVNNISTYFSTENPSPVDFYSFNISNNTSFTSDCSSLSQLCDGTTKNSYFCLIMDDAFPGNCISKIKYLDLINGKNNA